MFHGNCYFFFSNKDLDRYSIFVVCLLKAIIRLSPHYNYLLSYCVSSTYLARYYGGFRGVSYVT